MVKRPKQFNWKTHHTVKSHKRRKSKKHKRWVTEDIILEIQDWQGFLLSFLALLCSSSPTGQVWVGPAGEPTREMHLGEDDGQDSTERWRAGGTPCRGGSEQCRKQEKAATSQWGLPHGMWSKEQVAGRPRLDSAVLDSHTFPLLQWSVMLSLIPSSLHFHTKLPPPGCTVCSAPRDSPATYLPLPHSNHTIPGTLLLILGTTDLLHLLKWRKHTYISSPSLTSILQGFWWRLFHNIPNLSVSVLHSLIAWFLP